jgi:hypothetical protein
MSQMNRHPYINEPDRGAERGGSATSLYVGKWLVLRPLGNVTEPIYDTLGLYVNEQSGESGTYFHQERIVDSIYGFSGYRGPAVPGMTIGGKDGNFFYDQYATIQLGNPCPWYPPTQSGMWDSSLSRSENFVGNPNNGGAFPISTVTGSADTSVSMDYYTYYPGYSSCVWMSYTGSFGLTETAGIPIVCSGFSGTSRDYQVYAWNSSYATGVLPFGSTCYLMELD